MISTLEHERLPNNVLSFGINPNIKNIEIGNYLHWNWNNRKDGKMPICRNNTKIIKT